MLCPRCGNHIDSYDDKCSVCKPEEDKKHQKIHNDKNVMAHGSEIISEKVKEKGRIITSSSITAIIALLLALACVSNITLGAVSIFMALKVLTGSVKDKNEIGKWIAIIISIISIVISLTVINS